MTRHGALSFISQELVKARLQAFMLRECAPIVLKLIHVRPTFLSPEKF